jgi:hypothetical protein
LSEFKKGDPVQVLCEPEKVWRDAVVVLAWEEVQIPSGERSMCYDVDGEDAHGLFHGRFKSDHVKAPGTANARPPQAEPGLPEATKK